MLTDQEMRDALLRLTKERNELAAKCEDMERSANSAREIARVAMSHTGTFCIQFELTRTAYGVQLIICSPQNEDPDKIAKRAVRLLDPALRDALGIDADNWTPIGAQG